MHGGTLDMVSRLLGAARYDEVDKLVRALERDSSVAGESTVAELFGKVRQLCGACRSEHARIEAHWLAATEGAVKETDLRRRMALLLERVERGAAVAPPPLALVPPPTPDEDGALPAAAELAVQCLGPLRVVAGGRDLGPLPNRRARSVLKYLVLHRGRPTPKDVLMDLLWPDAAPGAARNNLNAAVYGLRRFLRRDGDGSSCVRFARDGYEIDPTLYLWVDVDEFGRRVAAARMCASAGDGAGELRELVAAAALHRGALFEDDPYEDWTLGPRRAALDGYVDVLDRLAARYRELGDVGRSATVARRILQVQRAHEPAHRRLMSSYAQLGQQHLALRQFRDCADALRDELDVAPGPETVALHVRIRRSRGAQSPAMNGAPAMNGSLRASE